MRRDEVTVCGTRERGTRNAECGTVGESGTRNAECGTMGESGMRNAERGAGREKGFARRRRAIGLVEVLLAAIIALWVWLIPAGCAQNNEPELRMPSQQITETPTSTEQSAAVQGTQIYFDISQVPGNTKHGDDPYWAVLAGGESASQASVDEVSEGLSHVKSANATFSQAGFHITIQTGGTTPSQTGTTTASASPAQTPTGSQTTTPTQTVTPETGISLPVAVALPGGVADSTAAASGGAGSANQDKQGNHTATAQILETLRDQPELARQFLEVLSRQLPPSTPAPDANTNGAE